MQEGEIGTEGGICVEIDITWEGSRWDKKMTEIGREGRERREI